MSGRREVAKPPHQAPIVSTSLVVQPPGGFHGGDGDDGGSGDHSASAASMQLVELGTAFVPTDATSKKRMKMEKTTVMTRWACPREVSSLKSHRVIPVADCQKCHGAGCSMEVYASSSPAERFVFVIERTEKFNKYICRACGDIFSGTQSRIVSHRLKVSGRGVMPCPVDPTEEVLSVLRPLAQDLSTKQTRGKKDEKKKQVADKRVERLVEASDVAVARFFFDCGIPFSTAEHPAFARMLSAVAQIGGHYAPPSKARIMDATGSSKLPGLLWSCWKSVQEEQNACLQSALAFGATLVSDGAKNAGGSDSVAYVLSTREGIVYVGETIMAAEEMGSIKLASDAAAMVKQVGADLVFLTVMDGPDVCVQSLAELRCSYPRMLVMRSARYGWDRVLRDIGNTFPSEVLVPVNAIILHMTNHPAIYRAFEALLGAPRQLLQPADARMAVEVICLRAFLSDKERLMLLWGQGSVHSWLNEAQDGRAAIRSRHLRLSAEFLSRPEWWRAVEFCAELLVTACPLLTEGDLNTPNLFKLPLFYDRAVSGLQNWQSRSETGGLAAGSGVKTELKDAAMHYQRVASILAANKECLVSPVSLAAAMVFPPFVYQEPAPYEPEGGRIAFNDAALQYFSQSEGSRMAALLGLDLLRNRGGAFGTPIARRLAEGSAAVFFEAICVTDELRPFGELALKLLQGVGTLAASDNTSQVKAAAVSGGQALGSREAERLAAMRMHHMLKPGAAGGGWFPRGNVLFKVRKHWADWRRREISGKTAQEKGTEAKLSLAEVFRCLAGPGVPAMSVYALLDEDLENPLGETWLS